MGKPKFNFQPMKFATTPVNETNTESPTLSEVTPAGILQESPKPITEGFQIKIIPRNKIRTNKKNRYGMREIDKLKESILQFGLQQNLTVIYSVEEDRYIIEAGHRRCQALDELIEEFSGTPSVPKDNIESSGTLSVLDKNSSERYNLYLKNVKGYESGYPCKVNSILKDDISYDETESEATLLSEARLIITNENIRSSDSVEKANAVARLEEIYQKLNIGRKKSEKINVMEQVATDLNIAKSQVAKYKTFNKLLPELKEEFDKNKLTLTEGSEIGKLSEEEQRVILSLIQSGEKVPVEQIRQLKKEKADLEKTILNKESQIEKLQRETEEYVTALNKNNEPLPPSAEELKAKEDLHRKEEEIKILRQEIKALKNQPLPIIDSGATNLYRAELAARAAHENLLKAQADFISSYTTYEKLIHAAPMEVDKTILSSMEKDYKNLL